MYDDQRNAVTAAEHLLKRLHNPSHSAVSISTFFRPKKSLALKVFISPQYKHLASMVPNNQDGFDVLYEIATPPTAN